MTAPANDNADQFDPMAGRSTATVTAIAANAEKAVSDVVVPPTPGVFKTVDGQEAVFMTEEQYLQQAAVRQSPALPLTIIAIGALGAIALSAIAALPGGGPVAAMGAVFGTIIGLVLGSVINGSVGWVVAKLFGIDLGTLPEVFLRYAAVTAAYTLVLVGCSLVVDPIMAMLFSLPALLIFTVWLGGLDFFQAMIFTVFLAMVNWMMMSMLVLGAASAATAAGV